MDDLYAKKGSKVMFNGRYELLPKDISHQPFVVGAIFTVAEDMDPGDSYSTVDLVEVPRCGGINTVAFENIIVGFVLDQG